VSRSVVSRCCQTVASRSQTASQSGSGGRAFDVLMALIERRGAVVGKQALIARVWPQLRLQPYAPLWAQSGR
jgi:hypothetical protein